MALMDPYGLSLVSVETWGLLWGFISLALIAIPYERQGRVFGFAQLVENAAAPLTAFLMAPLAETAFMPFMTDGLGADWIGGWFGTGPQRGIALIFTLAGLIGVVVTVLAWQSRSYHRLSVAWSPAAA